MNEICKFLSMGYIPALTQVSVLLRSNNVRLRFKVIAKPTNNISYTVRYSSVCEFVLHADISNLGSVFLATDNMSFLQSPDTRGQT